MNLRIGAFGRQESAAAVLIASFFGGCFSFDSRALFGDGNLSYLVQIVALIQALLLFEAVVWTLRVRGGNDLSALIGTTRWKKLPASVLVITLLIAAVQPLGSFLVTITEYVFVESKQVTVCLYLLPCLFLLTALGAETLVRTARILLPVLLLSVAAAMLSGIGEYHMYRLYPIPTADPFRVFMQAGSAQLRTAAPLLALLCVGEGTQNRMAMRSAGRIGAISGGLLAAGALFLLSLTFPYTELRSMSSPFYRMLVEVRAENPTLRLDRVVLFLWLSGTILTAAFYLYSACVLFAKTFGVRDVRPVALCLSGSAVTLILVLYYDSEQTVGILKWIYQNGWIAVAVSVPPILIKRKRRTKQCAVSGRS